MIRPSAPTGKLANAPMSDVQVDTVNSAARIVEFCRVSLQLSQEEIIQSVIMARSLVECQRSADKSAERRARGSS